MFSLYRGGMQQFYSVHRIVDGKWEITLWIYQPDETSAISWADPDLRKLIAENYDLLPFDLAKTIVDNVLHCERVQINDLSGNGIYVER